MGFGGGGAPPGILIPPHHHSGLTENDLIMAQLIDKVPAAYSPKWLREHPEAAEAPTK